MSSLRKQSLLVCAIQVSTYSLPRPVTYPMCARFQEIPLTTEHFYGRSYFYHFLKTDSFHRSITFLLNLLLSITFTCFLLAISIPFLKIYPITFHICSFSTCHEPLPSTFYKQTDPRSHILR